MLIFVNGQESSSNNLPLLLLTPTTSSAQQQETNTQPEFQSPTLTPTSTETDPLMGTISPVPIDQVPSRVVTEPTEPTKESTMTPLSTDLATMQPQTETEAPMELPTTIQPVTEVPTFQPSIEVPATEPSTVNQPPSAPYDDQNNGNVGLRGSRKEKNEKKKKRKRRRKYTGDPSHFGDGCPSQTVEFVTSTDQETVSVLFSSFIAETSETRSIDIKTCTITLNFNLESVSCCLYVPT
jgi:hypothetical protein